MNLLDWIWNLPALPSLVLLDTPFAVAIVWLVWRVRLTVNKSSKLMDVAPDLTEEEKTALTWSIAKQISMEVRLYEAAKKRGEVR
jgi:hypothetical protein